MITEQHELLTAHFTNDDRTIVCALWVDPETNEITEEYIEAVDHDASWNYLLNHINIDQLHENTFKFIKEQKQQLDEYVLQLAKDQGMIYDIDNVNTEMYKAASNLIFKKFDAKEDKEALFMYKLSLFENEVINGSKNRKAKAAIRKAKTLVEATRLACDLFEAEILSTIQDESDTGTAD